MNIKKLKSIYISFKKKRFTMKIFLITLFCVFFKKIISYNSTIVSHNIFSFTLNNSYIIYRYYLSSKYSSNTLMIYCQKRDKGGMLYYYQNKSTIKNYPDYPLYSILSPYKLLEI